MGDDDDRPICGTARHHMALLRRGDGDVERGRVLECEERVARLREAKPKSLALAEELTWLGQAHGHVGDTARAVDVLREAWAIYRKLPRTTEWLRSYALSELIHRLKGVGQTDAAYELAQWHVELCETKKLASADDARWQASSRVSALKSLAGLASPREKEATLRRALAIERATAGPDPVRRGNLSLAIALQDLARACDERGKHKEAAALLTEAVADARVQFAESETAWFVAEYLESLAAVLRKLGRLPEAHACEEEALLRYRRMVEYFTGENDLEAAERFRVSLERVQQAARSAGS